MSVIRPNLYMGEGKSEGEEIVFRTRDFSEIEGQDFGLGIASKRL